MVEVSSGTELDVDVVDEVVESLSRTVVEEVDVVGTVEGTGSVGAGSSGRSASGTGSRTCDVAAGGSGSGRTQRYTASVTTNAAPRITVDRRGRRLTCVARRC